MMDLFFDGNKLDQCECLKNFISCQLIHFMFIRFGNRVKSGKSE